MGPNASQLGKDIFVEPTSASEHYGFVNFGNTCYCNSVLQALFFCRPFRDTVLHYKLHAKSTKKETLLSCLADLFYSMAVQKRRVRQLTPKKFICKLRKENEAFDNFTQQDAHEFLNFLLNQIADLLQAEKHSKVQRTVLSGEKVPKAAGNTWIQDIFQGTLTSETRCLNCETVRTKDEDFLDLSVDVAQNTSITHCLLCFSNLETMHADNKYFCEVCCSKQEAQKRMRVKRLPLILSLHLKRFKYIENMSRFLKLSYRVAFPLELRLFHTSDDAVNSHHLYNLVAVVVHCGASPNRGHYITVVRSHGQWLLFDDEIVEPIDPMNLENFFGVPVETNKSSETAYILFYQARGPLEACKR